MASLATPSVGSHPYLFEFDAHFGRWKEPISSLQCKILSSTSGLRPLRKHHVVDGRRSYGRKNFVPLCSSSVISKETENREEQSWDPETYGALLRGGEDVAGVMKKMTEVVSDYIMTKLTPKKASITGFCCILRTMKYLWFKMLCYSLY